MLQPRILMCSPDYYGIEYEINPWMSTARASTPERAQAQWRRLYEVLLGLHWVAILYGHIRADLAVTGGIHTAQDVVKEMMAGARVAMLTSALLKHGIELLRVVRANLLAWLEAHEYASIRQMLGSMSYRSVPDPSAFERANYMRVLGSYVLRA